MPNQNKQKKQGNKPKHPDKNKGQSQGKHKDKNKGKGKGQGASSDLYDPNVSLTGKDLKKLVKSQVRLQTKPAISADRTAVKTLKDLLGSQTKQLKGLDQQAGSNIQSYYKDLANEAQKSVSTSQALSGRLGTEQAQVGTQTQQAIGNAADASTAALTADEQLRGQQPSSARDELLAIIAQQKGGAAREQQAMQDYGQQQGNTWQNTLQGMAGAAQMQGAATLSDTHRDIANRITDLQNQYAPDIRSALDDLRTTRKTKGDLKNQLLMQLRDSERQYNLSKGALGVDKGQLKASTLTAKAQAKAAQKSKSGNPTLDVAKQYGVNKKREQVRTLKNQLAVISAQADAKSQEQAQSLQAQLKVAQQQLKNALAKQKASTNSQLQVNAAQQGAGGGAPYTRKEYLRAKDLANARLHISAIKSKEAYVDSIATLVNGGVSPEAARAYLKKVSPYGQRKTSKNAGPQGGSNKPKFY